MEQNNPTPVVTQTLAKIESPVSLLKFSWKLLTNHWKVIVPIAVLPSLVGYVGTLFSVATHNPLSVVVGIIFSIAGTVLSVASIPALINTLHRLSTDPSANLSIKEQYRLGFGYFWVIIITGALALLVGIGATALLIIPGIIVGVYISLYTYALVIDGKKGFEALTESYALVDGRWLPVVGRGLFLGLISMLLWLIIGGVATIFGLGAASSSKTIAGLFSLFGTAILSPLAVGYTYRMYTSLKSLRQPTTTPDTKFKKVLGGLAIFGGVVLIACAIIVPVIFIGSIKSAF